MRGSPRSAPRSANASFHCLRNAMQVAWRIVTETTQLGRVEREFNAWSSDGPWHHGPQLSVCNRLSKLLNRNTRENARFAGKPNSFNDLGQLPKLRVEGSIPFARSNPPGGCLLMVAHAD